jgi:group I intron endonuclease
MNFVYLTTNLENGKQYVGSHNGEETDDYLGSGRIFLKAINKYGAESFKREILEECIPENNLILEEKYIKEYKTLIPNGYNVSPTGGHGLNGRMSEDTKRKISEANTGKVRTPEMRKNISKAAKGKQAGDKHPFYGKHHTEESIKKISENRKGKTGGDKHHYFGKSRDEETKQKIREKLKGQVIPDNVRKKISNANKNVKKVVCEHCGKEFTPWGFAMHKKALIKRGYIN